ncbi:hypothetical protein F8388_019454 [Cannabis sativa]|uniref:Signal peptidase complex-like protein DTM1 n=2 Tax=Cannabis sativa TaxID=3483 RepID=A0AB40E9E6_CANSA|nr:hypothetical protein F8388_019454 [Cannabis sativa]KAF4394871.1 hypothetical protein G4B88_002748 [Cannabis sativa]
MANDTGLRSGLIWLAAVVAVVGVCTLSFKKIVGTYLVGVVGLAGVFCPDWAYFDRDFSRWIHPVTADERASHAASHRSGLPRQAYLSLFSYIHFHLIN